MPGSCWWLDWIEPSFNSFQDYAFFGGYVYVVKSDTALSGTVVNEGESILGAGSRMGNSGVFSVLPLTPCGLESLS